jgi:murein tripeptide amidase MpaA
VSLSQNYKQVKIFLKDITDVETLQKNGLEFDHPQYTKDKTIEVFLNDSEFELLKSSGFRYEILIDDWYAYYNKRQKLSSEEQHILVEESWEKFGVRGFHLGSMGGYMTLAEVNSELDTLKQLFPSLITAKEVLGNTIENRPVFMVKISDNPDMDEDEPEVLYTALHHAREPESMMQMFYFAYYLLENYNSDPAVQFLVNNRELYFIPVVNPDGYE